MTRPHLSRERIVQAALEFIDIHGPATLSMRKLGASLDVEAMAIYRHVEGREGLLEAVVQRMMSGVLDDLDERLTRTWQGYLQAIAHRIREVALSHPKAFPLMVTQHPAAPWVRPPIRDLDLIEHLLTSLRDRGLPDEEVVGIYQMFSTFLMGHLLLEAMQLGADAPPADLAADGGTAAKSPDAGRLDAKSYPAISELSEMLQRNTSEEQFEIGLESLIDRIEISLRR